MANVSLHVFSGSHYDIGVQQGKTVRESMQNALRLMPDFEAISSMKPRLLPTSVFLSFAKRRADKMLRNDIFEHYPKQAQHIKGIAEGAGVDIPTLLLIQSLELLIQQKKKTSYHLQACTSLGFRPQRTTTKETIIAKNFDFLPKCAPLHLTRKTEPTEGYQTLGCTVLSFPGMLEGMNEHGLAVNYNYTYTIEEPEYLVPLSIALQEMLETCKDVDEAVKFITHTKRAGNALLTLADAQGNINIVEITSNHAEIRKVKSAQVIATNHFDTPEMQKLEIPRNAVYSGTAPKALHGLRVHESSEQRLERATELLKGKAKVDENEIASVLRDHGRDNKPSMLTICRHSELVSTLRSTIFHPDRRTIKVLYGNPCQNKYTEFQL